MSPRVTRRKGANIPHQRQNGNNIHDVNDPKPQASTETLQKVSKPKPTKLVKSIKKTSKKQYQKYPVVEPAYLDVTSSADEMPLKNRLSAAKKKVFVKKPIVKETTGNSSAIFKRPLPSIINQKVLQNSNQSITKAFHSFPSILNQTIIQNSKRSIPTKAKSKEEVLQNPNQSITKAFHSFPSILNQTIIQNSKQSIPKKAKSKEEVCKEMFDKCDKQTLFKMMVKELDGEEILRGYKEKRNCWEKKEIQEEASRVLDISLENQHMNKDVRISSLQKVLKELSNLVESGDEFAEMVLKTYSSQLKAKKIFELLELDDLKRAILEKFTANDMLGLFSKTDYSSVVRQMLEMASIDAIVDTLKSRNSFENSQKLLKVSLEMLSDMTPETIEQTRNDPSVISNLQSGLTDAIVDVINSKKFLKTSESLLNFMLQNVIEIESKETKKNFLDFLIKKFSSDERADISHEVIKSILNQNKKISLINISD